MKSNVMKVKHKTTGNPKSNDDKNLWIIIGVTAVVLGGVGYWYYKKRKKGLEVLPEELEDNDNDKGMARIITNSPRRPSRFRCSSRAYPLQYGTCHKDVKVLQSFLHKIYKADLGRSGRAKNGVDGMFGNKTNKAAKRHLQKTSFSKQDIDGMRTAIKTIKK